MKEWIHDITIWTGSDFSVKVGFLKNGELDFVRTMYVSIKDLRIKKKEYGFYVKAVTTSGEKLKYKVKKNKLKII